MTSIRPIGFSAPRAPDAPLYPPGRWVRFGFVAVAIIDATLNLALFRLPEVGVGLQLQAIALAAGHILGLGLVLSILADVAHRFLPARRWVSAAATLPLAAALGLEIFRDDYSVFELPVRAPLLAASILPFPALIAMRPWLVRARWRSAACAALALALTVQNPLVLAAEYEGIHLGTTLLAGLLAAIGLEGLASALYRRFEDRWRVAKATALFATCLGSAAALVLWPSNQVIIMLTRLPTASLVTWLATLHQPTTTTADVAQGERQWFTSRANAAAIAPTKPPLYAGSPLVVFVTIDALRADIVSEGERPATANIRRIAEQGTLFTFAHSSASATSSAIGSLFAGRHYSSMYWTKLSTKGMKSAYFTADDNYVGFPALLTDAGVQTRCVVTSQGFEPGFGLSRGFGEYTAETKGAQLRVKRIVDFLETIGDEKGFVYAHIMDAHHPYTGGGDGPPFERYLGAVGIVDEQMGKLWDAIEARGLANRTYLFISADHGEAFGEHNKSQHGNSLYEEVAHIPLIMVGPGIPRGRIEEPVSLIDMGPTILDLFGVSTPGSYLGQSLLPVLRGDAAPLTRPIALDTECGKQAMIGRDRLKIIRDVKRGTTELYDLEQDPKELVNLADSDPEEAQRRASALVEFFKVHEYRRKGYKTPYR